LPTPKQQLDDEKKAAANAALGWVRSGMLLGLGSGSTSQYFIHALGQRVKQGALHVEAIASSIQSEKIAAEYGIRIIPPARGLRPDLAVDGADEIAPDLSLIKGGGGALLREKAIANAARYFLVIADSSKLVRQLGAFPLPIEVVPFTLPWVLDHVQRLGADPVQRLTLQTPLTPFLTDQGNYIVDCRFKAISHPSELAMNLEKAPGVVGHGLFLNMVGTAVIAQNREVFVHRTGEAVRAAADFNDLP
jgi:ribose 5-phosphate isomerase A